MDYQPDLPLRLLSLDPTCDDIGWAVLDIIALKPFEVIIESTGILSRESLSDDQADIDVVHDKLRHLIIKHEVQVIACLDSSHLTKANDVAATHLVLRELAEILKGVDAGNRIWSVPLDGVKSLWTGDKEANRDIMRLAYQTHHFLTGVVPDDQITEEEIRAVACGVTWAILNRVNTFKAELKAKKERYRQRALV